MGKRKFGDWIGEYVPLTRGLFIDDGGNVLGRHGGAERFTLGQRARVGGESRRWFVHAKTKDGNVVLAPERTVVHSLEAHSAVWVAGHPPSVDSSLMVDCRYRHTQPLQRAALTPLKGSEGDSFRLDFERGQTGVAPGQIVAIYQGPVCLGGAVIRVSARQ